MPTAGQSALAGVRSVFLDPSEATVTQTEFGVIHIVIGEVNDRILRTRVSILALSPLEQYNPSLAIVALEHTPEMMLATRQFNIRQIVRMEEYGLRQPIATEPHLPPLLRDMTADEILDKIALTFHGVVLYGACWQPPVFDINFSFVD
jgi:hypothetical protein